MGTIERRSLYNSFLERFPLESLSKMPLDVYTNLNKEDSFCYWLESKTYHLGSIWGGSSYKFGIYKYKKQPSSPNTRIQWDDTYAWYTKYGKDTATEAYKVVLDSVIKIANLARAHEFESIDYINTLGNTVKWKIAFLYSNESLIPIYNRKMLESLATYYGATTPQKMRISEIQRFLFAQKGEQDLFDFYEKLLFTLEQAKGYDRKVQTWIYSPGENARKWDECLTNGKMYLGWDEMGDLELYESRDDMKSRMKDLYGEEKDYRNDSLATWEFANEINIGDIVFAKKGRNCILGRGIVTGEYECDENRSEYINARSVKWDIVGEWELTEPVAMKTLTNLTPYPEYVQKLNELVENKIPSQEKSCQYWWLCANPKIWSMIEWKVNEEQDYTLYNSAGNKRRVFQHFLDAKVGDKVICYETTPTKQITALATISRESDGEKIWFKKIETLTSPIDLSEIKSMPELANMEFLVNPNGSFFQLTESEYTALLNLIRDENDSIHSTKAVEKYTKADFLNEVFMEEQDFDILQHLIKMKKNIILQGAPGVGKTFCAHRLAQAIMGEKDESRIALIQFHQNYSYEDFVMGYKPAGETFELQKGIFYKFCVTAANHPDQEYFFIIDEINRGNLSKIFGELLMLIEKDYRGKKLTLAYKDEKFSVPENLYLIGMMNTADRSLALIDYALRRRFSFFEMQPGFDSNGFKNYLKKKNNPRLNELVELIKELNRQIEADDSLGKGFEIGHSYLCTQNTITDEWLKAVVNYDILPMLQEYWFDNKQEVNKWSQKLNEIFHD